MVESQFLEQKTDAELVKMTLENQENFLYLVNRYERRLLAFILKISNVSFDEAQDLLQEVFIKVYKNLNDFDTSLKFSSWIYQITRNHVISHYRKNMSRPQVLSWEFNEEILKNLATDLDIGEHLDFKNLKEKIYKTVELLKPKYREVVILRFFEEKNYQEISDIIKKPPGTVATLLSRAKKQLKKLFQNN